MGIFQRNFRTKETFVPLSRTSIAKNEGISCRSPRDPNSKQAADLSTIESNATGTISGVNWGFPATGNLESTTYHDTGKSLNYGRISHWCAYIATLGFGSSIRKPAITPPIPKSRFDRLACSAVSMVTRQRSRESHASRRESSSIPYI